MAQALDQAPLPSPLEWLRAYQRELLRQAQDLFHHAEQLPQVLHLQDFNGPALAIHCPVACTVAQLLDGQRISLGWNESGGLSLDGQQLPLQSPR